MKTASLRAFLFLLGAQAVAIIAGFSVVSATWADAFNDRPDFPQDSGEPTLQAVFDAGTMSGPAIDAVNDQISAGWFHTAGANATASVVVRLAGDQSTTFGIYDVSSPDNTATLFSPFAAPGDVATVDFVSGGVHVLSNGSDTFYAGNYATYGFWLAGESVGHFYSDDDLNNGEPFAVAYRGRGATTFDLPGVGQTLFTSDMLVLGWEDLGDFQGGDNDFQDFVVAVQGVTPVPEPSDLALTVVGMVSLVTMRRRCRIAPTPQFTPQTPIWALL